MPGIGQQDDAECRRGRPYPAPAPGSVQGDRERTEELQGGRRQLVEAVRAASAGDALISPSITLRLLRDLASARRATAPKPKQPLSERETEVSRAIARGRTNREIAAELFISLSTVKSHLATIQNKLRVRNRVEIAAWAWESRLMDDAQRPSRA